METVSYSTEEKIRLLKANGYVVRRGRVSAVEDRIPIISKSFFTFKAGRKYNIDTVFESTVKSILLMINPGGGEEEEEGGFYTEGIGIDISGAVISLSHLGFEDLADPGADRILFWDNTAGKVGWTDFEEVSSKFKVSSNDTTPGYLEDKLELSYGENTAHILELAITNEGANEIRVLQLDETKISHDNIADVSTDDHHSEVHTLATTGPHTGSLPLIDLAPGTAGDIITRQAADWAVLTKGTQNYVLKMGATYPAWGQVAWGEVTGKPSTFAPSAHAMDSAAYHTSTDITTLNATVSKHGFLRKLGGGTANYLRADGTWATPPGTGTRMSWTNGGANRIGIYVDADTINAEENLLYNGNYLEIIKTGNTTGAGLIVENIDTGISAGITTVIQSYNNSLTLISYGANHSVLPLENHINTSYAGAKIVLGPFGETGISTTEGAGVELYFNNFKKIETLTGGGKITGDLTVTGIANNDQLITTDANGKLISEANLVFTATGLGIGTNSPDKLLHLEGSYRLVQLALERTGSSVGRYDIGASSIGLQFWANGYDVDATADIVFDLDGKVGIGTASPASLLHIKGTIYGPKLILDDTNAGNKVPMEFRAAGIVKWELGMRPVADGHKLRLYRYDGSYYSVITFDHTNGNVGINQLSPSYKLDVNGTGRFTGLLRLGSSIIGTHANYLDLYMNTSDGSDTKTTRIGGGGDVSVGRGAFASFYGNEHVTYPGDLLLNSGTTGEVYIKRGGTTKLETTNVGILITGDCKATNYRSSDNSLGVTTTVQIVGNVCNDGGTIKQQKRTITIKDGLITSIGVLGAAQSLILCPA